MEYSQEFILPDYRNNFLIIFQNKILSVSFI